MVPFSTYRKQFLSGEKTLTEIVTSFLECAEQKKNLNAFVNIYKKEALERAKKIDQKLHSGKKVGSLAGMVLALKDNIALKNVPLTCSSYILGGFRSVFDAFASEKLLKQDVIILGHTNMDEFAMGSSNETSCYGGVKNPYDTSRVSGGSSGGSAVAVAAEMVMASLGSDTGGSVRQPAAFTGVYGLKPTYGRISRNGLVAFASSLDQIGVFANFTEDLIEIFDVIAKHDPSDSTSVSCKSENFFDGLEKSIKGLRIGIPSIFFQKGLNQEIYDRINELKKKLKEHGALLFPIELPHVTYSVATYYILATAEASSNLSRFDGIRYGMRKIKSKSNLDEMYALTRGKGFGVEVKRRIMLGSFVLSHGYYDAYYKKAQKVRRLIQNDFNKAFKKCDIILGPTTPSTAFKFGKFKDNPLSSYLADIYTAPVNLSGNPALSIPYGMDSKGLPIGIQFIASHFCEKKLFWLSQYIEKKLR